MSKLVIHVLPLSTFDETSASHKLRVSTRRQGTTKGHEGMREAKYSKKKSSAVLSFAVVDTPLCRHARTTNLHAVWLDLEKPVTGLKDANFSGGSVARLRRSMDEAKEQSQERKQKCLEKSRNCAQDPMENPSITFCCLDYGTGYLSGFCLDLRFSELIPLLAIWI